MPAAVVAPVSTPKANGPRPVTVCSTSDADELVVGRPSNDCVYGEPVYDTSSDDGEASIAGAGGESACAASGSWMVWFASGDTPAALEQAATETETEIDTRRMS